MATILQIKQDNEDFIRSQVVPNSITTVIDAGLRDAIADELRDRGVLRSSTTAGLAAISRTNTMLVLVTDVGFFVALFTADPADNETTFASADAGWLWQKILSVEGSLREKFVISADDEYVLIDGFMIDKIALNPGDEETFKIGTTDGGDEVMLENTIPGGQWYGVTKDIYTNGANATLYFRGLSGVQDITIIIYKRKL